MGESAILLILKWLGVSLLGVAVLWRVADRAGPARGEVVLHVVEGDVDLDVDGKLTRIGQVPSAPLLYELELGDHTLTLARGGRVLDAQSFTLKSGEEFLVLTSWDRTKPQIRVDDPSILRTPLGPIPLDHKGAAPTPSLAGSADLPPACRLPGAGPAGPAPEDSHCGDRGCL